MQGTQTTKLIVYTTITLLCAYDLFAAAYGWKTISEEVRELNRATGWLLCLAGGALWLHFFFKDLFLFLTGR